MKYSIGSLALILALASISASAGEMNNQDASVLFGKSTAGNIEVVQLNQAELKNTEGKDIWGAAGGAFGGGLYVGYHAGRYCGGHGWGGSWSGFGQAGLNGAGVGSMFGGWGGW